MDKLIIDITELAQWEGRLTGVPRVMNELCMWFATEAQPEFVVWDNLLKQFQPVVYPAVNPGHAPLSPNATGPKASLVKNLKSLKRRSKLVQKGYILAQKALKKQSPVSPSTVSINPGDTLFIMADWHGGPEFVNRIVDSKNQGVKLAQIAYDLLPLVTPQYSGHGTERLGRYVEKIYPLCDVIFSISAHTKADITVWLKNHNLTVPRIEVFRLGDDFKQAESRRPTTLKQGDQFLLCVGTIEARKNHTLLYYVYKLATQKNVMLPKLVIVGRRGWLSEDIYKMMTTDPATKDKFIFLQTASDEELAWLYKHCLFSIYASLYEGWGLPVAESIAYGAPCLASRTSSIPEIAGDLIEYFNPLSGDDCLEAIQKLLEPKTLAIARSRLKDYTPTTWHQTYQSVKNVIEELHD